VPVVRSIAHKAWPEEEEANEERACSGHR